MRQVFGEWGVVTETKSASYGILSAPVANNIRGYLILCQSLPERDFLQDTRYICGNDFFNRLKGMFSTYILSQLEISFLIWSKG